MSRSRSLRAEAETIWKAGLQAVDSERLIQQTVLRSGSTLEIAGSSFPVSRLGRIAVVGAGKAGAGMAAAFEGSVRADLLDEKVFGWVNVPADCLRSLQKIHLHPARPAGLNEPTEEGVHGSREILQIVENLTPDDLCVVLLSGGGSALLPAPVEGISLSDKQAVTRLLMRAGASIEELNCVRKQLSRLKGGGLARATRAGRVVTLIISDVIGDPLGIIASGPTAEDSSTAAEAQAILRKYAPSREAVPHSVWTYLVAQSRNEDPLPKTVSNHIIGNNRLALDAAAAEARQLGYRVHCLGSDNNGEARLVGAEMAALARRIRDGNSPPACVLRGGEPVVHLPPEEQAGKGGRNQELVLAGLEAFGEEDLGRIAFLSGGTDGEDGPTDAAGAVLDAEVAASARRQGLVPRDFLTAHNSYAFFAKTGGLLKTGPTGTNVMDIAVVLVAADD